ncbi:MAG: hypothetical protein ACKO0U_05320 [Gammaproteobacteria bacterium]
MKTWESQLRAALALPAADVHFATRVRAKVAAARWPLGEPESRPFLDMAPVLSFLNLVAGATLLGLLGQVAGLSLPAEVWWWAGVIGGGALSVWHLRRTLHPALHR